MNTRTFFSIYQKHFDDDLFLKLIHTDNTELQEFVMYLKQDESDRRDKEIAAERKLRLLQMERLQEIYERTNINPLTKTYA